MSELQTQFANLSTDAYQRLLEFRSVPIDLRKVYPHKPAYSKSREKDTRYGTTVLRGIYPESVMVDAFFSKQNMKTIDTQLRYAVWQMSHGMYSLGPQDEVELAIIMRSIFLNYSINQPCNYKEQIRRLNNIVVVKTAPELVSRATQYLRYLEDANESHTYIFPNPKSVNYAGDGNLIYTGSAIGV